MRRERPDPTGRQRSDMPGSVMTVIEIVTLFVARPTLYYGGRQTRVRSDVALGPKGADRQIVMTSLPRTWPEASCRMASGASLSG